MSVAKKLNEEQFANEIVRDCLQQYGRYVLEDRAVPDVRDGLKPSQRRVLWAMHRLGLTPGKPTAKSSRVVGSVTGLFHPHGDAAAYDTLVNLTHARYPLIHGDGNFGNTDTLIEMSYAAPRYTECRLTKLGATLFDSIHISEMVPNYDDTDQEPTCLPSPIPMVLVNGTSGVAVGLATQIPPHNLGEVLQATLHLLDNPDTTTTDLLQFIKGPDYGTGALLSRKEELLDLYETGLGKLRYDSLYHVEEVGKAFKLVITGLAPSIRKAKILETVEELAKKGLIDSPVTDESTLKGSNSLDYRDTIKYRDGQVVRDRILPLLGTSIAYRWYCLGLDGRPRRFNLLTVLGEFLTFRREVEGKVLQARKEAVQRKLGVVVAKYRASLDLDRVAKVLKEAKTDADAIEQLCSILELKYDWQAEALLETTLRALARHRSEDWQRQGKALKVELQEVKQRLADIDGVIRESLQKMLAYSDARGMKLRTKAKDFVTNSTYWVGVTPEGKVDVALDLPLKSKATWNYQSFVPVQSDIVIVHDSNQAAVANVSYLDKYQAKGKVVGATGQPYCLVASDDGKYVAFPAQQRRRQFQVFREDDVTVTAAVGFDPTKPDTQIMVVLSNGSDVEIQYHAVTDIKITRPNVRPKRFKLDRDQKVVDVRVALGDDTLVDDVGGELGWPEDLDDEHFHVVGPNNLVVLKTNARKTADAEETMGLIEKDLVSLVVPLPSSPAASTD